MRASRAFPSTTNLNPHLIFDEMAINSSGGGHAMPTTDSDHEKEGPSPIVQHLNDASTSDIDADDLPKGYFTRPYFLGTMVAAGLALAGVSNPFHSTILRQC